MITLFERAKNSDRTAVPEATPLVPAGIDDEFAIAYDRLAEELGVWCVMGATGHRRRLLNVLRSLSLSVYPLEAVEKYLDRKGHWGWFPLRFDDCAEKGRFWIIRRNDQKDPGAHRGYVANQVYDCPVPSPVLVTVHDILQALTKSGENGKVIFMVAALANNPDPFLGVRLLNDKDRRMIVIERWDEPSFRR